MTEADKYYEGGLADDKASVDVVGFDLKQRSTSIHSKKPVQFQNCTIQKQPCGEEMEVVVAGSSEISTSPCNCANTYFVYCVGNFGQKSRSCLMEIHRLAVLVQVQKVGARLYTLWLYSCTRDPWQQFIQRLIKVQLHPATASLGLLTSTSSTWYVALITILPISSYRNGVLTL